MLRLLLLLGPALLAAAGGGAAGYLLRERPVEEAAVAPEPEPGPTEHMSLPGQFVVPIVRDGHVSGHMVMSLGISYDGGYGNIHAAAPRLRDALTEALLLHTSLGGFSGDFTQPVQMNRLRLRLNEAAGLVLDDAFRGVLIEQILRREL